MSFGTVINCVQHRLQSWLWPETIYANWFRGKRKNWGDCLNPYLIRAISGMRVMHSTRKTQAKYMVVGSIIGKADAQTIIWGAGCLAVNALPSCPPKRILAVRGPLSRDVLLAQGLDVPRVYGDPALLLPRYYNPTVPKTSQIGIVPHYIDQATPWLRQFIGDHQVRVLNICEQTEAFVQQVKSCQVIISSSLHGIICADAYGIPSIWVELSGRVAGDGFKFYDYFRSIGHECSPVQVTAKTTLQEITSRLAPYTVDIDLDRLLEVCPFGHVDDGSW